ncbi:hypothetical protein M404DRAFT_438633 [Pisolithus tinctorius Marx 270]|uniref:Uncharacterized protein n=1 Tax=Pisolithus tinctorius Marx 270 TaxID=870435 RepID=A0A0C3JC84_PISTI|nr:hypothetical protein M404DRAFT_438633 [Pisolithus tinctorius Marx 270]
MEFTSNERGVLLYMKNFTREKVIVMVSGAYNRPWWWRAEYTTHLFILFHSAEHGVVPCIRTGY